MALFLPAFAGNAGKGRQKPVGKKAEDFLNRLKTPLVFFDLVYKEKTKSLALERYLFYISKHRNVWCQNYNTQCDLAFNISLKL